MSGSTHVERCDCFVIIIYNVRRKCCCLFQNTHIRNSVATARVFSLDLGVFCFIWGSGFFLFWSNFIDVCCIAVFSIQAYSSFTGVLYAGSVASTDVTSRARFNQIVCNLKLFTD